MTTESKTGIAVTVFLVLLIIGLFLFSQSFSLNLIQGNSMEPTFGLTTYVISDIQIPASEVVTGDIVIIDRDTDKFAHRVVENNISNETISTRGDNDSLYDFPSSVDGFFTYDQFEGRVTWGITWG